MVSPNILCTKRILPHSNLQLSTQDRDQHYSLLWFVAWFYRHICLVLHYIPRCDFFVHFHMRRNTAEQNGFTIQFLFNIWGEILLYIRTRKMTKFHFLSFSYDGNEEY